MAPHLHETMTGLRQRIDAAGIRLVEAYMSGSEWRGADVGYVPRYTVTLAREDDRTLAEEFGTGEDPFEPTAFDIADTLLCFASLIYNEGIGDSPESRAQAARFEKFVIGPDCWEDWLYYTDRDPGRQEDYDEPEDSP